MRVRGAGEAIACKERVVREGAPKVDLDLIPVVLVQIVTNLLHAHVCNVRSYCSRADRYHAGRWGRYGWQAARCVLGVRVRRVRSDRVLGM